MKATGPEGRDVRLVFLAFASAYFLSALLRAVTATLAPEFSRDLGIAAADLGLLAGAYFLGFSLMQLPMGHALDRYGPKPVLLGLLIVAAVACTAFAQAKGLAGLVIARACVGVGVSACLMAPLTAFRHLLSPPLQLRCNSWMLMTGSLGMMASTLPVQLLLPAWGWRGLFWALGGALLVSVLLIAWAVPSRPVAAKTAERTVGYREIARNRMFLAYAPLGFFVYGGLIAWQALWIGPWLTRVAGYDPTSAALGLLLVNGSMLLAFLCWGLVMPRLEERGIDASRLATWGVPVSLLLLSINALHGAGAGAWSWAAWCVATTVITPSQPALGQAFPAFAAGRALSAYNLVVFSGVFVLQWGIGLALDALTALGWSEVEAFRGAIGGFGVCCFLAYLWFLRNIRGRHNVSRSRSAP